MAAGALQSAARSTGQQYVIMRNTITFKIIEYLVSSSNIIRTCYFSPCLCASFLSSSCSSFVPVANTDRQVVLREMD